MLRTYNKFFIQLIEIGCSSLIYWDKETKIKIALKLNDVLESKTVMKIRLVQKEILVIGR